MGIRLQLTGAIHVRDTSVIVATQRLVPRTPQDGPSRFKRLWLVEDQTTADWARGQTPRPRFEK